MHKGIYITGGIIGLAAAGGFWYAQHQLKVETVVEETVNVINSEGIDETLQGGVSEVVSTNTIRYESNTYGFSFTHPDTMTVRALPELEGESLVISDTEIEWQIFVSEYTETETITVSRIQQDLPDLIINEPQVVKVGKRQNIEALIFNGTSKDFGATREVWLVGNGYLYQVIAPAGSDTIIGPILNTWEFIS